MNRDEIIRMAREAKLWPSDDWYKEYGITTPNEQFLPELERFAALVAAAEREKVARWQIGSGYSTGHGDTIEDLLTELEWQVRESEREACAKVCEDNADDLSEGDWDPACNNCAAAIRARGQE